MLCTIRSIIDIMLIYIVSPIDYYCQIWYNRANENSRIAKGVQRGERSAISTPLSDSCPSGGMADTVSLEGTTVSAVFGFESRLGQQPELDWR